MLTALLALALAAEPAAPPAQAAAPSPAAAPTKPRAAQGSQLPLPPPARLGSPFAAPAPAAAAEPPPEEVTALLARDRTLVEARRADLDLDGSPEWILVAGFQHPDRLDYGPRSSEWRAGQRIVSRAAHELVVAGKVKGEWAVRFTAELHGGERQALFVEPLARADGKPSRLPVVITGARACVGTCGPMELHVVAWDGKRKALQGYAWTDAEFAQLTPAGTVEAWFADRRPGDPVCCPSGYSVMELALFDGEVDVKQQRSVAADQLRRLLPPGKLIERVAPPAAAGAEGQPPR